LIVEFHPYPNPNPGVISVLLRLPVDSLEVKVYTVAMVMVGSCKHGSAPAGWVQLGLPEAMKNSPAAGLYHFVVSAQRNGSRAQAAHSGKLLIVK